MGKGSVSNDVTYCIFGSLVNDQRTFDRYTERKMTLGELIDTLKSNADAASDSADSLTSYARPADSTNRSNSLSESCGSQTYVSSLGIAGNPIVNFHIIIDARKRYEKQVTVCSQLIQLMDSNKEFFFRFSFTLKQPFKIFIREFKWTW